MKVPRSSPHPREKRIKFSKNLPRSSFSPRGCRTMRNFIMLSPTPKITFSLFLASLRLCHELPLFLNPIIMPYELMNFLKRIQHTRQFNALFLGQNDQDVQKTELFRETTSKILALLSLMPTDFCSFQPSIILFKAVIISKKKSQLPVKKLTC